MIHSLSMSSASRSLLLPFAFACLAFGCDAATTASATTSALASSVQDATESSGVLLCAPVAAQIEACANLSVGDACTLIGPSGESHAGLCRASADGTSVACAPSRPAPRGDRPRPPAPPTEAVDACSALVVGDACALPPRGDAGASLVGICSNGPDGTGDVIACAPLGHIAEATDACADLAAGDACTLSRGHESASGTCTQLDSGATVCVVGCGDLHGPFDCRGR